MNQKIAIYDGEGTCRSLQPAFFSLDPLFIQAKELLEGILDQVHVLIMPGGRDRPYHAALKGPGNAKIRSFVERGGRYIGICGGAYYGCRRVVFDPGLPLEVCEERELGFFMGAAIGPAYGFGTFDYETQRGALAALLETDTGSFHSYYNGGCYFEGDLSECTVLARYGELPGKPAAAIACPIGSGIAILSGAHIETSFELLTGIPCSLGETCGIKPLLPLLQSSEQKRKEFWSKIVIN